MKPHSADETQDVFLNIMSEEGIQDELRRAGFEEVDRWRRSPEPEEFQYDKLTLILSPQS